MSYGPGFTIECFPFIVSVAKKYVYVGERVLNFSIIWIRILDERYLQS